MDATTTVSVSSTKKTLAVEASNTMDHQAVGAANKARQIAFRTVESLVHQGKEEQAFEILNARPKTITINGRDVDDRTDTRFGFRDLEPFTRRDGTMGFSFKGLNQRFIDSTESKLYNIEEDIAGQGEYLDADSPHLSSLTRRADDVAKHLLVLKKISLMIEKAIQARKMDYSAKFRAERAAQRKAEMAKVDNELSAIRKSPVKLPPKPSSKWVTDKVVTKAQAVELIGSDEKLTALRKDSALFSTSVLMVLNSDSRLIIRKNGAAVQYALENRVSS